MSHSIDENRFLAVLEEHKKIIYKICNFYCRNPDDREDLGQEIIIQLWKSFNKYNEQYKLSTWIYRVALNVAISCYRSKERTRNIIPVAAHFIHLADEPAESGEAAINLQLLYRFIYQLDELSKALMLLYLDNNSYKDIATVLGITETNVATKINRIKQKLKQQFKTV